MIHQRQLWIHLASTTWAPSPPARLLETLKYKQKRYIPGRPSSNLGQLSRLKFPELCPPQAFASDGLGSVMLQC
ncbi:hypothetical protein CC2G_013785 [Coprinopsis cinerea AmutBmut pab1-1]|nr:hypothetical protein CC2G_013785 [Coprinopsis cinerea AmutBmut pab1-1]